MSPFELSTSSLNELIGRAQRGDKLAADRIVRANMGLARAVSARFARMDPGDRREDLFQVACLGLVKAIEKFDPGRDVKFSTFAVSVMIREIKVYLRTDTPLKVGRALQEKGKCVRILSERLTQELGRSPSISELAAAAGMSREEVSLALDANARPESLESAPIGFHDDAFETQLENMSLRKALSSMESRERTVILMRFFRDMAQSEVAEELGISQPQVSRIEKAAIASLRRFLEDRPAETDPPHDALDIIT